MFLSIFIDGKSIQKGLIAQVERERTKKTVVFSFDDTIEEEGYVVVSETSYFDEGGVKIGPGTKPFQTNVNLEDALNEPADRAILVDVGIWSGKTMDPLIDKLIKQNIKITVLTGFIKQKARERFETKGVYVKSLMPFNDYDDWAEVRDLLVLFVKSGFFMGKQSQSSETPKALIYGTFFRKYPTYYTQPSYNLGTYYESLQGAQERLTSELLRLSYLLWSEMERLNPDLTLGKLRELFPTRFGLPLVTTQQVPLRFSTQEKPSEAIQKMYKAINNYDMIPI